MSGCWSSRRSSRSVESWTKARYFPSGDQAMLRWAMSPGLLDLLGFGLAAGLALATLAAFGAVFLPAAGVPGLPGFTVLATCLMFVTVLVTTRLALAVRSSPARFMSACAVLPSNREISLTSAR